MTLKIYRIPPARCRSRAPSAAPGTSEVSIPTRRPAAARSLFSFLSERAATGASDSYWEGRQRRQGAALGRRAALPDSLGQCESREGGLAELAPDPRPPKGEREMLQSAGESPITADPPRDDAFMINTHDNLRAKCCYNTNCPWKLTCSKAAEFSFDRPGSRVRPWLGMTGDIHASKISESAWRDFAHCRKAVEILHSCLFVRQAERTAGGVFVRASYHKLCMASKGMDGSLLPPRQFCSYYYVFNQA